VVSKASSLCLGTHYEHGFVTTSFTKPYSPTADPAHQRGASDVRWLRIDNSSVKRISRQIADNYKRTYLRGGEVLVTVRGTLGGAKSRGVV
jgi:type I restriction enzyme S subunit